MGVQRYRYSMLKLCYSISRLYYCGCVTASYYSLPRIHALVEGLSQSRQQVTHSYDYPVSSLHVRHPLSEIKEAVELHDGGYRKRRKKSSLKFC